MTGQELLLYAGKGLCTCTSITGISELQAHDEKPRGEKFKVGIQRGDVDYSHQKTSASLILWPSKI